MTKFRRRNFANAKLLPEDIVMIRRRYNAGETQGSLSREYRMSIGTIGRIVRGESWQDIPAPAHPDEIGLETARASNANVSDAEIQASLAKLQKLMGGGTSPPTGGDAGQSTSAASAEQPGDKHGQ